MEGLLSTGPTPSSLIEDPFKAAVICCKLHGTGGTWRNNGISKLFWIEQCQVRLVAIISSQMIESSLSKALLGKRVRLWCKNPVLLHKLLRILFLHCNMLHPSHLNFTRGTMFGWTLKLREVLNKRILSARSYSANLKQP